MKSIVIGTAGHIDHGKSALVKALTGTDPDRLKEERERGITIDLGFAHATIGDTHVAFVDVPGHERFVKNMLAGVGGIDAVMLVVSADESVMPQTREHFAICRLLRVGAGLIALTKADLVDSDTLELVRLEIRDLVKGSFLDEAPVVAVSAVTGEGLDGLKRALGELAGKVPGRSLGGAARLPIDRVFSIKGFGTVVTGTLVSGRLRVEEELLLRPGSRSVKIRGLQVHGGRVDEAFAGQRVAANLGGIEVGEISRGDVIAHEDGAEATRALEAVIEVLAVAKSIRHGARVRFHQGTVEVLGRVAISEVLAEPALSSVEVPGGRKAYVRIRLESDAVLTRGDRFILRAYSPSVTIAGGVVLDPRPPRVGVRTVAGRARFSQLSDGQTVTAPDVAVMTFVDERGLRGASVAALARRTGLERREVIEIAARLQTAGAVVSIADLLVPTAKISAASEQLLEILRTFHRTQPLADGISREEARERVIGQGDPAVFDALVTDLTTSGQISGRDRLALSTHRIELTSEEEHARVLIERVLAESGLRPPEPGALASSASIPHELGDRIVTLLLRQRVLVRVEGLVFHREALAGLKRDIAGLKAGGTNPEIDVATFKARYGVTRKFAIPLLEYLDRERVTRRVGDKRVVI